MIAGHSHGVEYVLAEGNTGPGFGGDVFHGSQALNTLFRNYFLGTDPGRTDATIAINILSWNRYYNLVGNVLGTPGYSTTYNGFIYDLGSGNSNGTVTVPNDSLVATTMMRWGNYDTATAGVRWDTTEDGHNAPTYPALSNASQTLPASFYYSAKPNWWPSAKAWPPIGPVVTGGNIASLGGHVYSIPAKDCYLNVMGGPVDGTGNPLTFNASTCYPAGVTPPTGLTGSVANNTSACSAVGIPTAGCNGVGIMPFLGVPLTNVGLQTTVINPIPTNVSSLDLHSMCPAGTCPRTMVEYQTWFCNTSSPSPCNGHKNIGMQESNPTQVLFQAQYMKTLGADVTDVDYYGCGASCDVPQSGAQAYNLSVTTALANAIVANSATTPKFEIMIDGGSVNGTGTGQCPTSVTTGSATCLIAAINLQMDYLAENWLFQSYYEKNATNSHPIVLFFFGYASWQNTDFNTVFAAVKAHATLGQPCSATCTYTQTVDLVDENSIGFTETGMDGGYAWPQPKVYSSTNQLDWANGSYISGFYAAARAHPTKIAIGLIHKGFDDHNANWGLNRVIAQQCGQTLSLAAAAISTAGYSSASPLQYVQFATWNDYEEATEIETGVNNCITINQPTIAGGNVNWTLNKSDATYASTSTISSFAIFTGTTSPTTLYASNIAPTATSFVAPSVPAGTNVWVYMVGKPLIQNQLSPATAPPQPTGLTGTVT